MSILLLISIVFFWSMNISTRHEIILQVFLKGLSLQ